MRELVALKVQIGLKAGQRGLVCAYPDFNKLPKSVRGSMDWASFVDQFGGWHYDNVAGHADHDPDNGSPAGKWIGMLLVPEDFASEAVAMFPDQCSLMDETEAERFYEDRVTVNQPDELNDTEALQGVLARVQLEKELGITPTHNAVVSRSNALNPEHPTPGIRRNVLKSWIDLKRQRGFETKTPIDRKS